MNRRRLINWGQRILYIIIMAILIKHALFVLSILGEDNDIESIEWKYRVIELVMLAIPVIQALFASLRKKEEWWFDFSINENHFTIENYKYYKTGKYICETKESIDQAYVIMIPYDTDGVYAATIPLEITVNSEKAIEELKMEELLIEVKQKNGDNRILNNRQEMLPTINNYVSGKKVLFRIQLRCNGEHEETLQHAGYCVAFKFKVNIYSGIIEHRYYILELQNSKGELEILSVQGYDTNFGYRKRLKELNINK